MPAGLVTLRDVEATAVGLFQVTPEALIGRDVRQPLRTYRTATMVVMRTETGASYPRIGAWFGRDHSTVMLAIKRAGVQVAALAERLGRAVHLGLADEDEPELPTERFRVALQRIAAFGCTVWPPPMTCLTAVTTGLRQVPWCAGCIARAALAPWIEPGSVPLRLPLVIEA